MSQDLLNALNPAQQQAVTTPMDGNVMVLAGAGSGKTLTLVRRMAYLVSEAQVSPGEMLAVTFTNKAAAEVKTRLSRLLDQPVDHLWVGTFHGLAHRLLRRHTQEAKLPEQFQVLDSDDQLRLIKQVMAALSVDPSKWPPKQVQYFINAKKDEGLRAEHIDDLNDRELMRYKQIYQAYEQACERTGSVDFSELLLRALELWQHCPALLAHYQQRFRYVLVDEFQDTNAVQYAWIHHLACGRIPAMVVGDDDQSIYGWRGAKVENIRRFQQDFNDVTVVRLEQNYRSTAHILAAANALIEYNSERMGKSLWTQGDAGEPVAVYQAYSENDEARFVVDKIRQLASQWPYDKMAILYRSNALSRVFEDQLIRAGVPYRIYGGLRFFERAEIKDVLAYLRLLANRNDDTAFERVINLPARGIGERTLSPLRELARSSEVSLWHAAEQLLQSGQLTPRATNALQSFLTLVTQLSDASAAMTLDALVDHVMTHSGLWQFYTQSDLQKAQTRADNLKELVSAAKQFLQEDSDDDLPVLQAFLAHASLEAGEAQATPDQQAVQLMTMHAAKGLEFPLVFVVGMEEGVFPSRLSVNSLPRLEEERRLCYVAMTRAERLLFLTHAERRRLYGREEYHSRSRFLNELPLEHVQEVRMKSVSPSQHYATKAKTSKPSISNASSGGFRLGQAVTHPKFGAGVILQFDGEGTRARVQVHFKQAGSKWLILQMAKLQPTTLANESNA